MLQVLSDVSRYVCFQLRILDVTEVFVLKYCPLCLNITSKSETEMFSMNNQRKMFTCESRTVTQRVTNRSSPAAGETSLANHTAKKSNNPQNNSGLCQYIISELQPFT